MFAFKVSEMILNSNMSHIKEIVLLRDHLFYKIHTINPFKSSQKEPCIYESLCTDLTADFSRNQRQPTFLSNCNYKNIRHTQCGDT